MGVLKAQRTNGVNAPYRKDDLLSYPVIAVAVHGEPDAVAQVIRHYSGYIAVLSMRMVCDAQSFRRGQIDHALRRRLECKLTTAILQFRLG